MSGWEFVHKVRSGHKFFKELGVSGQWTGRIGMADDSGRTPDLCEDGAMFLDMSRPITISWSKRDDGWTDSVSIPMTRGRDGREMHMGGSWHEVLDLAHRYNMRIETDTCGTFRVTQMVEAGPDAENQA